MHVRIQVLNVPFLTGRCGEPRFISGSIEDENEKHLLNSLENIRGEITQKNWGFLWFFFMIIGGIEIN